MKKEKIGILFFLLGLMFVFGGIGYSEISESWTEFWVGIGEAVIGMIFLILFLLLFQNKVENEWKKIKHHPWPKKEEKEKI